MRITNTVLLSALVTIATLSCKEDDDSLTLPPISSEGANTFGCLVDGKVFIPHGRYAFTMVDVADDMVVVYGGGAGVNFILKVRDLDNPVVANKTYEFKEHGDIRCEYLISTEKATCIYDSQPVSGSITFSKIDRVNRIVSGVFEFSAVSQACNRSVNITKGTFDLRSDY